MRCRDFVVGLWLAWAANGAWAQQPAIPTVGFMDAGVDEKAGAPFVADFIEGLQQTGFRPDVNVHIEYRFFASDYSRLADFAADLVRRHVAVIVAPGTPNAALAAHDATMSIPIVFATGGDAVQLGLVKSISRPGTNATGIGFRFVAMVGKRLELLHELIPKARKVAFLSNQTTVTSQQEVADGTNAASRLGLDFLLVHANTEAELAAAFASATAAGVEAMAIGSDAILNVTLAAPLAREALRAHMPILANTGSVPKAGGLASYGPDIDAGFREVGVYTGRILNGAKPADLPVEQLDRFTFILNLKTAKALGIAVPASILPLADEVIE
jgi:putative tryptophan/tyrosine transport system substrate-binding protein